jgi:7-keto-8-aminopelargonate synthetase-like enzyme
MQRLWLRSAERAIDSRMSQVRIEDENLDGQMVTIDGQQVLNFALCSYLGLSFHPKIIEATIDAVQRFGAVYPSSRTYSALGLYNEVEAGLERIFGGKVVLATTTALAHLSALPVLIDEKDAVMVDAQAHATLHMAVQQLVASGVQIWNVPHNDLLALEEAIEAVGSDRRIWYLTDGVFSMGGETTPVEALSSLLDRFPNLHLYIDDAHGVGWAGFRGRGVVLERMALHPRLVVAAGLAKSFSAGGAVLIFGDPEMAEKVFILGGPLTFSGPVHPPQLGALLGAIDIHLSPEHLLRQNRLHRQFRIIRDLMAQHQVPLLDSADTPVWFVPVGGFDRTLELGRRMLADGFSLNVAAFPAVPAGKGGLRFTNTLLLTDDHIASMVETLGMHYHQLIGEQMIELDLTQEEAQVAVG